jgi:GalNAc-alpha-(1->4)-GalNAc-alpha-(1->3)-diNAcBac-PP-undecaprenol alpha-1,4-N-acetyl-D-galactosaminyltransferase
MQKKFLKRITMIISSLEAGGAERVMSRITNYWAAKGLEITLLTFEDRTKSPFYELDPRIKYIPLNLAIFSPNLIMGIWNNSKRIFILRKIIRESNPDIIISFIDKTNIIVLLATRGLQIPVVVSEHIDIGMYPLGWAWERLRVLTYPWADRVALLNERDRVCFSSKMQTKITVIPNPVLLDKIGSKSFIEKMPPKPFLIAMGRLTAQKSFDLLLRAFALLKDIYPHWTLLIFGEGPLRTNLESLREELGLKGRVILPGVIKNPHQILKNAELFIMSSRFEGFPMALCEAMACGLPVISTEYHSGVRDIIDNGVNGILVPVGDINTLSMAMNRLMGDETERKRLGAKAVDILHQFGLEKIMGIWEGLIERAVVEKKG